MILDISVGSVEDVVQAMRDIATQIGRSSNPRHKAAGTVLRERADQLVEALRLEERRNVRGKWYLAPLPGAEVEIKADPEPESEPAAAAAVAT